MNQAVVCRWARGPRCVGRARKELRKTLEGWGLGTLEDAALVVLSELLTNAVRHACVPKGRQIETRYVRVPGGLRIEVHDAAEERPLMAVPGMDASGGWGLPLVDALADRWAVADRVGPGKMVWAELDTASGGGPGDA
ncbi:ATP-binding protein [Streptomyces sp. NPDC000410]|uniref:ATP-binding protein n=1 Tax=Streptomyces sp. NPDC000410 TaxID=3154254 RepID=UPI003324BC3E